MASGVLQVLQPHLSKKHRVDAVLISFIITQLYVISIYSIIFHLFWIPQKNTYLTWFIPYGIIMELWIWDKHGMIHISNSQSLLVGRKHQPGPNRMPRWHLPVFPWILGDSAIHQPAKISCSMVMRIDWSRT